MKAIWIASIWPEPESSAGGLRTLQLILGLRAVGWEMTVVSPCQKNAAQDRLENLGIATRTFAPNDSSFDAHLLSLNPDIVFFDRFMIEEQFSFRVRQNCPNALRVLDTIDLHFLRKIRQRKVQLGESAIDLKNADFQTDDTHRELASILRSDLSLLVSNDEFDLLTGRLGISRQKLEVCRIFYSNANLEVDLPFEDRNHFMVIGNYRHPPNKDAFILLLDGLWDKIRSQVKALNGLEPELHIFGAYPTNDILNRQNLSAGIRVCGRSDDVRATLRKYRVNLVPIRFGAGIRGKILDGWSVGTPCVSTAVGAEGVHYSMPFGGELQKTENDWDEFAQKSAELYCNRDQWQAAQVNGSRVLQNYFDQESVIGGLVDQIGSRINQLKSIRDRDLLGQLLWHQTLRSTEYFSRWIEAKNSV